MDSQASTLHERANYAEPRRDRRKLLILLGALALLALVTAGGIWYAVMPHSATDQIERARKLETRFRQESGSLSPQERDELRQETIDAYRKVMEFPADDAEQAAAHVDAHMRLADPRFAGEAATSRQWWQKVIETQAYRDVPAVREAYTKLAESLAQDARALPEGAAPRRQMFTDAAGTYEAFLERYGQADPDAPAAAMARIRILQDDLADTDEALAALDGFLEHYGSSDLVDEALYRRGLAYQQTGRYEQAVADFDRLIAEHPGSEFLKRAEWARAEALTSIDPQQGEQAWRELAEKYGNDPDFARRANQRADDLAGRREQQERQREQQAAREEAEDYRSQRYGGGGGGGGGGPLDSGWGKPIPPQEMLRDFIEQQLDATDYQLTVRLVPAERRIRVSGTMQIVNDGGPKRDFLLMLGAVFEPGTFTLDGRPVTVSRPPGKGEVIHLQLDQEWPTGQAATLAFDFAAQVGKLDIPPEIAEQAIEQLGRRPAATVPLAAPVAQEAETETETEPEAEPAPAPSPVPGGFDPALLQIQVNQTGYALSGASWYPVTIFGDLFTATVTMEIEGEQTAVCSGRLEERREADGVQVSRWACEKELFGLYFSYGPYVEQVRDVDGVRLAGYFLPDQEAKLEGYLDAAEDVLRFYVDRFGPFPFEKLAIVQVELPPILGGVGPASLLFLHSMAIERKEEVLTNLVAHELSHQWWGNLVPINLIDANYSQWLSEGFATYSDALYTEHSQGEQAFREHVGRMQRMYLEQSASVREDPVVRTFMGQSPLYRVVVYEKGAMVLHALRYVVGDEAFFRILREYAARHAFQRSTVDDFRHLASEVAGENLDWFFNEWLDQPGSPYFRILRVDVRPGGTEAESELDVHVVQPEALSGMPLDVEAQGPDGQTLRIRSELGRKENVVPMRVAFPVRRVVLDPDHWVLRRGRDGDDAWQAPAP